MTIDIKTVLLSAACGTLLAQTAIAQSPPAPTLKGIEVVDSLVSAEFARDSIGSITVGIISGSQLVWTRSVGYADMKARRLANRNTVYRIGSITKPFTAVMLMQLVAAGKIQLSDPVERYLPEVRQIASKSAGAAPFTFLQLATMTAGLAREPEEVGPFWTGPVSKWEETLLSALPHTNYISLPGVEYSYSNIGYAILGAALGRAAGQPYVEWERQHVFKPLGMNRTRFEIEPAIASDVAVGYEVRGDGTLDDQTAAQEARDGRGYKVPNGAIFTTVDDLARFVVLELSRAPDSVLARSMLDEAFEGIVASDRDLENGYGLGFMAMRRDDYSFLGHNGGVAGYLAAMYYDRGMKLGVVLFRNVVGGKEQPNRLAIDILALLSKNKRSEIQADIDRRVKAQVASPGSEAALRRLIEELRTGKPNYDLMSPALARETRRQLNEQQATITKLGPLRSLTFKGVGPAGPNIYQSTFEKGSLEWRLWLNLDGSVDVFRFRPVPTGPR
ncbi:MAG TPA: serine hydrolase domain-containing protein [Gemmatimonadaceae bacterium]|nr:serine hydrolase domain-containing protein [Gemmatimonadaceae bacterium]